jgi:hypothetical protein
MPSLAPRLGGWESTTTRCGFYTSPSSQARGLDAVKLLDAVACEDWRREKFYIVCHNFLILNSKSWNLDSRRGGCGTHVIGGIFFKFLEDKDQKIED